MALARAVLTSVVAALSLALFAAGAPAHESAEHQLRTEETATLGAEHAGEHARLRAYARDPRWRRAHRMATASAARMRARIAAGGRLDRTGRWPAGDEFDIRAADGTTTFATHAVMLPTGKVLWYSIPSHPDRPLGPRRLSVALLWDPSKGTGPQSFKRVNPPVDPTTGQPVNIWCSGNSLLADGRVLVTGGNLQYTVESPGQKFAGLNHVYTFDPFSERWTRQPDMPHGRWYPTQMLLPDGRTFIMGGLDERGYGDKNEDIELFTPSASRGGRGRLNLLGGPGVLGDPGRPPVGDYYPHMFWMPSGRGLVAGPFTEDSFFLANPGATNTFSISDAANPSRRRVWGNGVLVPGGTAGSTKVMELGGSDTTADYNNAFATNTS